MPLILALLFRLIHGAACLPQHQSSYHNGYGHQCQEALKKVLPMLETAGRVPTPLASVLGLSQ